MEEEEKYFSEFKFELAFSVDYPTYIANLRKDGQWGGNPELIALSKIYKRPIEVYENSVMPRFLELSNDPGNNGPPIRVFFRNYHYGSIRSDVTGDLFNFEGLEPGEFKQQMINLKHPSLIRKS